MPRSSARNSTHTCASAALATLRRRAGMAASSGTNAASIPRDSKLRTELLFLRGRRGGGRRRGRAATLAVVHHIAELDGRAAFVLLVVLILHRHADGHVLATLEM